MSVTDDIDPYEGAEPYRWQPSPEDLAQMGEWHQEQDPAPRPLHVVGEDDKVTPTSTIEDALPLLDWRALFAMDDDGEEWIVEPLLAARRMVALYSAPKAGKSLLVLEIAVAIARGTAVLGRKVDRRRVLYVDFENDPRGDVRRRLEDMGYDRAMIDDGDLDDLCYLSFPSLAKLDTPQGGQELVLAAKHYGCEVVVIDTVSRSVGGEENANDTWLAFYRSTGLELKKAGIACLRLDHSGKDAEKGMRGGSAKSGDVDAVWRLTAESTSVIILDCTDHRMPVEEDRIVLVRETEPWLHHRAADGFRAGALSAREDAVLRDIETLMLPKSMSANTVFKELKSAGRGAERKIVQAAVKAWKAAAEGGTESGTEGGTEPAQYHPTQYHPEEEQNPRSDGGEGGTSTTQYQVVLPPYKGSTTNPEAQNQRCPDGFAEVQHPTFCSCGWSAS